MNYKALIYDFDGVICDSVDVKTEAFAQIYKKYGPDVVKNVKEYHIKNGGISRFKKFKYFHLNYLGLKLSNNQLISLGNTFSNLVKKKVIESPFINGVQDFISINSRTFLQFICTGTPENEILEIAKKKNISTYFNEIYGSPKSKEEIISLIKKKYNLSSDEIVFFGDAMTDYNSSKKCNVSFIGVENNLNSFPKNTFLINDFLDDSLKKILKIN
ncbi:MAG: hypothetical protein CMC38_05765 [Flavobacteriaceae bacterium]|nr:hypothetical protein [Flavobacteriaceae bacterium]|tara:strand:+ start:199 stop:843 length:645 start_codon:yes stop_codon:yes gene_type:complete